MSWERFDSFLPWRGLAEHGSLHTSPASWKPSKKVIQNMKNNVKFAPWGLLGLVLRLLGLLSGLLGFIWGLLELIWSLLGLISGLLGRSWGSPGAPGALLGASGEPPGRPKWLPKRLPGGLPEGSRNWEAFIFKKRRFTSTGAHILKPGYHGTGSARRERASSIASEARAARAARSGEGAPHDHKEGQGESDESRPRIETAKPVRALLP